MPWSVGLFVMCPGRQARSPEQGRTTVLSRNLEVRYRAIAARRFLSIRRAVCDGVKGSTTKMPASDGKALVPLGAAEVIGPQDLILTALVEQAGGAAHALPGMNSSSPNTIIRTHSGPIKERCATSWPGAMPGAPRAANNTGHGRPVPRGLPAKRNLHLSVGAARLLRLPGHAGHLLDVVCPVDRMPVIGRPVMCAMHPRRVGLRRSLAYVRLHLLFSTKAARILCISSGSTGLSR